MPVTPLVSVRSGRSQRFSWSTAPAVGLAAFTFLVCYFRAFIFPAVPIVLWGDQIGFFSDGTRMVAGQLPYRDFFQIVPPGTDLVYALLIQCFGVSAWIPNLVMAILAAVMAWLVTVVARRFMVGPISALPALLFASFIMHGGFDATHHWFSTIAIMAAMLVFFDGTNWTRAAAVGALCGLAAFFTQTKGATAVVAFVTYLVWKAWHDGGRASECARKCVLLCGAAASVFFAANAYFIGASGLQPWLFSTIVFPLKYYSAPSMNNWQVFLDEFRREGGSGRWIAFPFMYATVPLVYIVFLETMRRRWKKEPSVPWDQLLLVALTGLGMFLAIADSPSMKRLCTVGAPGMILLAWLLNRPGKAGKVILAVAAVTLAVGQPAHSQLRWKAYLNLPAGRMAFVDPALYEEYSWVLANTSPGQYFFGLPPLYTPFRMRNPSAIEGIEGTEYTRPEQVAELIRALESHPVPLLILNKSGKLLNPTPRAAGDNLDPFRIYLLKNYRLTRTFSTNDDAWQAVDKRATSTPFR